MRMTRPMLWLLCIWVQSATAQHIFVDKFESPPGELLSGAGDVPAMQALHSFGPIAAAAYEMDGALLLSRVSAVLRPAATVAQVNAALASVGGAISSMRPGQRGITISIPRAHDAQALQQVIAQLQQSGVFLFVLPQTSPVPQVLPPGAAGTEPHWPELAHLAQSKFPAAWNAMHLATTDCAARKVTVLVPDFFHPSLPASWAGFIREIPDFEVIYLPGGRDSYATSPDVNIAGDLHGYDVSATLAAKFDEINPTGTMPFAPCLQVKGLSVKGISDVDLSRFILDGLAPHNSDTDKTIVNASFGTYAKAACGSLCTPDVLASLDPGPSRAALQAIFWMQRSIERWDDFLLVSAAGNLGDDPLATIYPGRSFSIISNPFNFARHLAQPDTVFRQQLHFVSSQYWDTQPGHPGFPSLRLSDANVDEFYELALSLDVTHPPAPNTIMVGASDVTGAIERSKESIYSSRLADVYAPVDPIFGLDGTFLSRGGTSYASPQVAGLAAYMWLLSPTLRAQPAHVTANAISSNTQRGSDDIKHIDAYASILSLDQNTVISRTSAPVRLALLDVNDDGAFSTDDLQQYVDKFVTHVEGSVQPTYARLDLNGDGFVGGLGTARFDLDRVGSEQFGTSSYSVAIQNIEGRSMAFSESVLTDLDILCYYAYSALYSGDLTLRRQWLQAPCGRRLSPVQEVNDVIVKMAAVGERVFALSDMQDNFNNPGGPFGVRVFDAQSSNWSERVQVSQSEAAGFAHLYALLAGPSTATPQQRDVVVAWGAVIAGQTSNSWINRFSGQTQAWDGPVARLRSNADLGFDSQVLGFDAHGQLYDAWLEGVSSPYTVKRSRYDKAQKVWLPPATIGSYVHPAIPSSSRTTTALGANGELFVQTNFRVSNSMQRIVVQRFGPSDGQSDAPQTFDYSARFGTPYLLANVQGDAALIVSTGDRIDGASYYFHYVRSQNRWTGPVHVTGSYNPQAMGMDEQGNIASIDNQASAAVNSVHYAHAFDAANNQWESPATVTLPFDYGNPSRLPLVVIDFDSSGHALGAFGRPDQRFCRPRPDGGGTFCSYLMQIYIARHSSFGWDLAPVAQPLILAGELGLRAFAVTDSGAAVIAWYSKGANPGIINFTRVVRFN
jgi:hypothetical protein